MVLKYARHYTNTLTNDAAPLQDTFALPYGPKYEESQLVVQPAIVRRVLREVAKRKGRVQPPPDRKAAEGELEPVLFLRIVPIT